MFSLSTNNPFCWLLEEQLNDCQARRVRLLVKVWGWWFHSCTMELTMTLSSRTSRVWIVLRHVGKSQNGACVDLPWTGPAKVLRVGTGCVHSQGNHTTGMCVTDERLHLCSSCVCSIKLHCKFYHSEFHAVIASNYKRPKLHLHARSSNLELKVSLGPCVSTRLTSVHPEIWWGV